MPLSRDAPGTPRAASASTRLKRLAFLEQASHSQELGCRILPALPATVYPAPVTPIADVATAVVFLDDLTPELQLALEPELGSTLRRRWPAILARRLALFPVVIRSSSFIERQIVLLSEATWSIYIY